MKWINPADRVPFVLEAERALPQEQQTRFILRPLLASDYVRFSQEIRDEDGELVNWVTYTTALLRYSLTGWEGPSAPQYVADAQGYPTDESLSRIPVDDRFSIGLASDALNKVGDNQAGKSPSP